MRAQETEPKVFMQRLRGKLKSATPQERANMAADQLGGGSGQAVKDIRSRPQRIEDEMKRQGFRRGMSYIKDKTGNGSPTKDTVPAKLAEGEAVLNAAAAEMLGRDEIESLNRIGMKKLGLKGKSKVKDGVLHAVTGIDYTDPEKIRRGSLNEMQKLAQGAPRQPVTSFGPAPNYGALPTYNVTGTSLATVPGQGARISYPTPPTYGVTGTSLATVPGEGPKVRSVFTRDEINRNRARWNRAQGAQKAWHHFITLGEAEDPKPPRQAKPVASLASRALRAASPAVLGGTLALESRPAGQGADWDASFASFREAQRALKENAPGPDLNKLENKTLISDADVTASPKTGIKYLGGIGHKDGKPVEALGKLGAVTPMPKHGELTPGRIWTSVGKDGQKTYGNTYTDGAKEFSHEGSRGSFSVIPAAAMMAPPPGTPGLAARAAIMERNIADAEAAGDMRAANMMRSELNALTEGPRQTSSLQQQLNDAMAIPTNTFGGMAQKRAALAALSRGIQIQNAETMQQDSLARRQESLARQAGEAEDRADRREGSMAQRRIAALQEQLSEAYGKGDTEAATQIEKMLTAYIPSKAANKFVGNFRDVRAALSVPVADATGGEKLQPDQERERQFFAWMAKSGITDTNEALAAFMAMQQPMQNPKVMPKAEHEYLVKKYGRPKADEMVARKGMTVEG